MNALKVFLLGFILLFAFGFVIFAQEAPSTEEVPPEVTEAVNLDEDIQPVDLEVGEPKILPDSPLYFLKNWLRGIQSFFTLDRVRKAELRMKIANEKLMEAKKLVELKKEPEMIKKAIENYQKEIERIKSEADRIKERAKENPKVENYLDKFIHQQTLHQKLLDRLENQVPPQAFEKIKEARERHLERFKDVMLKLEDRHEKIAKKLDKILEEQKGSEFKDFKNLEVLKDLEEKVPEEAKKAIQKAQERRMEKLQEKLEKMTAEKQEQLKDYVEKISGEKEKHLEIIGNILSEEISDRLREDLEKVEEKKIEEVAELKMTRERAEAQIKKTEEEIIKAEESIKKIEAEEYRGRAAIRLLELAKDHLERAKEALEEGKYGRAFGLATASYREALNSQRISEKIGEIKKSPEKMKEKLEELYPGIELPEDIEKCKLISPPKCFEGEEIIVEKTKEGCPIFRCGPKKVPPKEPIVACVLIWDPVCGKDGKTYSNECFARAAGVKVDYKGICKEEMRLEEMKPMMEEMKPIKLKEER